MSYRQATHAGSWYEDDEETLNQQLTNWLSIAKPEQLPKPPHSVIEVDVAGISSKLQYENNIPIPVPGLKAVIAPHAGYSYSGKAAAWAYKCIDPTAYDTVFILGPSHHHYVDGCMLTKCKLYGTPIGDLPVDQTITKELYETGKFDGYMTKQIDEEEHSIEMHLPYIRKVFENQDIKVVPILVGSTSDSKENSFGKLLAPYVKRRKTLFVVSSDFCHWGSRFRYTHYQPSLEEDIQHLKASNPVSPNSPPIHASIRALDGQAIQELTYPTSLPTPDAPEEAQKDFARYLKSTNNTICGRHPIGVLMGALAQLEREGQQSQLRFTRYEQSSKCTTYRDSSVSYASAFVRFES
ncbi:UPF0103-domain-containing protein [Meira miltonrushii]|uniref:UPF0103-domain-containing protein n=1 Tax=Meira miltonrushii TaxID=1280837 RepID=A0A316VIZ0_9BASI|nr:UPF0103-domain-containing protein [Meira miltonrushii]PWN37028.1 UPF0103-domain-containing protein [Meira miltonrushii]